MHPQEHGSSMAMAEQVVFGVRASMGGDAAVVMMADESDDPKDAVRYWRLLNEGWDCVFGSRFVPGAKTTDYPLMLQPGLELGWRTSSSA